MNKNILKLRELNEKQLEAFHSIENLKNKYIFTNGISILSKILETNYQDLFIKEDRRIFSKKRYEEDRKEILNIISFKKNSKFFTDKESDLIKDFIKKVYFPNNLFQDYVTIKEILNAQQVIKDLIVVSNYNFINKIVNDKKTNKILQQKEDMLYLTLVEELLLSIYKYDTSKNNKFITFFFNRAQSAVSRLTLKLIHEYSISQAVDYVTPTLKQKDFINSDLDLILNEIVLKKTINKFKIKFTNIYDYSILRKELVIFFNAIINNSSKISFNDLEIKDLRDTFIKFFKEEYMVEYVKIKNYTCIPFLQSRIIIDIMFLNKNLNDIITAEVYDTDICDVIAENPFKELELDMLLDDFKKEVRLFYINNYKTDNKIKSRVKKFNEKNLSLFKSSLNGKIKDFETTEILELEDVFRGNKNILTKPTKKILQEVFINNNLYYNLIS